MDCLVLGLYLVTGSWVVAVICGIGMAWLGKFKPFQLAFRILGWPLAVICLTAIVSTIFGMVVATESTQSKLVVLNFIWGAVALLFELAMLAGVIVMASSERVNGELKPREGTVVDEIIWWELGLFGVKPYWNRYGERRDICALSWVVVGLFLVFLILESIRAIVNLVALFIAGYIVRYGGGRDRFWVASRAIGISPALALLLALLFGVATAALINALVGLVGLTGMFVASGMMLVCFIVFAVWYDATLAAIGYATYHLCNFIAILVAGRTVPLDENEKSQKVLKYSPLALLIISAVVVGPLMWVICLAMGLSPFAFCATMVVVIIIFYLVLMIVVSIEKKPPAKAKIEPGRVEGLAAVPAPTGYFPTGRAIADLLARLKEAACPRFQ